MHTQRKKLAAYSLAILALSISLLFWLLAVRQWTGVWRAEIGGVEGEGHPAATVVSPVEEEQAQWGLTRRYTLLIPSLHLAVPVFVPDARYWDIRDWDLLEKQMQVGLLYGVVAYPHSVAPGRRGNVILAGHSSPPTPRAEQSAFGRIFERLTDLVLHDRLVLQDGDTMVDYEVVDTSVVPAGDTSILAQQEKEGILKLITCYPVGATKNRLIIVARRAKG